jgi:hypothetical protein
MNLLRSAGRQIVLSFVVISAVFAAGFFAGSSSSISAMHTECLLSEGKWADGFCTIAEKSQ